MTQEGNDFHLEERRKDSWKIRHLTKTLECGEGRAFHKEGKVCVNQKGQEIWTIILRQ